MIADDLVIALAPARVAQGDPIARVPAAGLGQSLGDHGCVLIASQQPAAFHQRRAVEIGLRRQPKGLQAGIGHLAVALRQRTALGGQQQPALRLGDASIARSDLAQLVAAPGLIEVQGDLVVMDGDQFLVEGVLSRVVHAQYHHKDHARQHQGDFNEEDAPAVAEGAADHQQQRIRRPAQTREQALDQAGAAGQTVGADGFAHGDAHAADQREDRRQQRGGQADSQHDPGRDRVGAEAGVFHIEQVDETGFAAHAPPTPPSGRATSAASKP